MSTGNSAISQTQGEEDKTDKADARAVMELLCATLADSKFEAAEVMRLIALKIASVVTRLSSLRFTAEEERIMRGLAEQVHALQALGKTVMDADLMRKKEDVLNFDGPAFRYVLGQFVRLFQEALKEAGVDESLRHSIMLQYSDLMASNESRIRQETEALGG